MSIQQEFLAVRSAAVIDTALQSPICAAVVLLSYMERVTNWCCGHRELKMRQLVDETNTVWRQLTTKVNAKSLKMKGSLVLIFWRNILWNSTKSMMSSKV